MRRFAFAFALAALALSPAKALSPGQADLLPLFGQVYTPPPIVSPYVTIYGDSRVANVGGTNNSAALSTGFTDTIGVTKNWGAWPYLLSNGSILAEVGFNYGIGSSTSAGIRARQFNAATDCNAPGSQNSVCFTGVLTTTSGTTASGQNTVVVNVPAAGTISPGDYIVIQTYLDSPANPPTLVKTATGTGCTSSGSGTCTITVGDLSGNAVNFVAGTAPSGTVVVTSTPSLTSWQSNPVTLYYGSAQIGQTVTDIQNFSVSDGVNSVATDPAPVVFFMTGVNDGNMTFTTGDPQPLINLAAILDGFGPTQANKIVIIGDEDPTGLAESWSNAQATTNADPEVGQIGTGCPGACTSPYTYTVHNGANYFATQQVAYAPCGTVSGNSASQVYLCGTAGTASAPFSAGASDGTNLINCTTGTADAPNGTATCTPSAGQYSVSSSGVYTFNSADVGKKIAIFYSWKDLSYVTAPSSVTRIRDWVNSSTCGSFQPTTGYTGNGPIYPISGALCNRPWVHVAPTWEANIDTTIAGNCGPSTLCTPVALHQVDGLHENPYGGALVANALLQTAKSLGVVRTSPAIPLPTKNNVQFGATPSTSTGAATSTCNGTTGSTGVAITGHDQPEQVLPDVARARRSRASRFCRRRRSIRRARQCGWVARAATFRAASSRSIAGT